MDFLIKVADRIVEIHSVYKLIYYYCREYLVHNENAFIVVSTTEKEIEQECSKVYPNAPSYGDSNYLYAKSEVETQIILRKIAEVLIDYSVILMHGTVVSDGRLGYMITAPSGTGKTIRARELVKRIQTGMIINGDKPFLRISQNETIAYGTPWCGKEFINKNQSIPLHAIYLLERSEETCIKEVSFSEALAFLIKQTFSPLDSVAMAKVLELLTKMSKNVKLISYRSQLNTGDIIDAYNFARRL